jgi:hypothetical protein
MSEIEDDGNLRAGALSGEVSAESDPMKSSRADQDFSGVVHCRAMVQPNERYGPLA